MRPIWKGSISFGLVYIPVAVYPATREEKLSFRQLRSSDLSPIRYKKVAEADSKEVPADQIVKGFEYERAGAHRKHECFLGAGKISRRIPECIDGDHRTKGAAQRDHHQSASSSGADQRS